MIEYHRARVANIKGGVILNARDFVLARDGSAGWRRGDAACVFVGGWT
jgi:hypothetical protein